MTPTTLALGKEETEGWMRLSEALDDGLGQPFEQPDVVAAALLSLPPDRRAAIAAELLDVETLREAMAHRDGETWVLHDAAAILAALERSP